MRKLILIMLATLVTSTLLAQNRTISGTITDRETGETLIGATVLDYVSGKGTVTNAFGQFSLTLPKGNVQLRISYVGYQQILDTFQLTENKVYNVKLVSSTTLDAVVVQAQRPTDAKSSQMSAIQIPVEHLKAVPVLFGEADVVKAVQLLPGVQSGSEGTAGMYVRGGGPDENLFLLDGVPLYNVNHMGGFFSAFNSDAVKNITLYKGSFPAHFGGRLSSVLDITTNNGNDKKLHGGISVGAIATKFYLEGPIVSEKTTFSLSARRTYADVLLQPFLGIATLGTEVATNAGYYFYDLNGKVTHKFNDRSRLFLSWYSGDDKIYARIKTRDVIFSDHSDKIFMKLGYNWGNIVGSARWNYIINPKLFMNVTGSYTRYRNNLGLGAEETFVTIEGDIDETTIDMSYNSGIQDLTARVDFDYAPHPDHSVKFGAYVLNHKFTPEIIGTKIDIFEQNNGVPSQMGIDTTLGESIIRANEMNAFIEDDWNITSTIKANAGVALSGFAVQGTFYPSIQPRLSGRVLITNDLSFKAGYAYTTQYLHLLSNSSISLPTDLWVPVTAKIAPMNAHQVAAGFFYNWGTICDLSIEGYFKKMNNLMEYKDGASFWGSSTGWEEKVCLGEGWSYGLEFLAQRTVGQFTGWIGYTLSRSDRRFNRPGQELSGGNIFPAKYDRRHDLSIVMMYKPNEEFDASISWVYSTGNAASLATQEFEPYNPNSDNNENDYYYDYYYYYNQLSNYENRNNYRMPDYHRMDVSVNFHKKLKRGTRTWNISVYNLYNRKNPYIIYEKTGSPYTSPSGEHYSSSLVQLSIFPIIPSVSYTFKF